MSLVLTPSPRKKRAPSDDESVTSPKKLRTASLASPSTTTRPVTSTFLPAHLTRIQTINASLQHALSVALATSAVSPTIDTGRVPNVLDHLSLSTAMGFTINCDVNDIKRLCWIWEWDGENNPATILTGRNTAIDDEDNPFLVPDAPSDWTRGAMGFIITPTTHFIRSGGKRIPAYGIGIEVEMDLATGKGGGMAAVARWTAEGDLRRRQLEAKLRAWLKMNAAENMPTLPLADLPALLPAPKLPSLTKRFAKPSDTSPAKSPGAHPVFGQRNPKEFALLFPLTPQTPVTSPTKPAFDLQRPQTPQTPSRQIGSGETTVPQTPTTSRRAALYERIRQKSLTSTPANVKQAEGSASVSRERMKLMGQEELKRRCLLGRLDEVAATVWASDCRCSLFSSPAQSSSTPLSVARKRRTMQTQEVVRALVSSAAIPISAADAQESLTMLMNLCPFFLRPLVIAGEDWVEMPASNPTSSATPPSPRTKEDSGKEVLSRSPKTIKTERGGLREVRERIRRELEWND
ncbi:hypothetical protein K439DRAFT_1648512 [Ramaria rubella]|nr:hypothetical protein K439DRAFT_1648512 [Ramaria rubella]